MRGTDFEFVKSDLQTITEELISAYEEITGHTVNPADPERLLIAWLADVIAKQRVYMNFVGNMNIPARATGEYLDVLGEWIYGVKRLEAAAAKCTVRFTIAPTNTAILIPAGTRVTDGAQTLVWATTADALIAIGDESADVMAQCETVGAAGNGWAPGQIDTLIDVDNVQYFVSCANTDVSDGGSETESDDDYYARMRLALDAYTTAGSEGAYVYHAKSVSDAICDVKAVRPVETVDADLTVLKDSRNNKYLVISAHDVPADSIQVSGATVAPEKHGDVWWIPYTGLLNIVPVTYTRKTGGTVYIYVLMDDGTPAGSVIKNAVAQAVSAAEVRPLTDTVEVKDPETVSYNVDVTYYVPRDTTVPLADMQAAVQAAVDEYVAWQCGRLGRDINPSKLWQLLMQTGIKRAVITAPTFTVLSDGSDGSAPQIAAAGTVTVTNGGYEDD